MLTFLYKLGVIIWYQVPTLRNVILLFLLMVAVGVVNAVLLARDNGYFRKVRR